MAVWKTRTVAVALALASLLTTAGVAVAQWPTTCVALNDIVEGHLGNHGNVGIYQRVFGDQAEAACRNDHRDDVRGAFAWAVGSDATAMSHAGDAPAHVRVAPSGGWVIPLGFEPDFSDPKIDLNVGNYMFVGGGDTVVLDRTPIKGGRYIVSTQQERCLIARLNTDGRRQGGIRLANDCDGSGRRVVVIPEGDYRLVVWNVRSDSAWVVSLWSDGD